MSEKDEVLQHLSAIKSVLVDRDTFFPYNYSALIVWGVIGAIITFVLPVLIKSSVLYGTLFSIFMMSIGFGIEGFLIKKVNQNYDIENCTKKQKFISSTFIMLMSFAIVLSALLAKYGLITPLFALWLFLCGMGDFAVGYLLNIRIFTFVSYISVSTAIALLIGSVFIDDLSSTDSGWFYFSQGISFLLLGVVPVLVGKKLKEVH